MIRDALGNLQFTSNVMQRGTREMLWTTKSTKLLVSWTIIAWVIAVLLMQTNQVLANQRDYTGWGLPEGAKTRLGKGTFTDMQLSRDGTRLAIASSTGVWLYDVSTGAELVLITENTDLIGLVAFSPDGTILATAGGDNKCRIWDVESHKLLLTFKVPDWLHSLRFLDDGKTIVGEALIDKISHPLLGGGPWMWDVPKVWMWDVSSGKRLDSFTTELPKFNPLKDARTSVRVKAFANSTRVIFAFENKDGTISVKDGRTNREIATLPKPEWEVRAFSFSPDGRTLAVATSGNVHFWDLETGKQVATFPKRVADFNGNPPILVFSKDGKTLAVAGLDGIEIWNTDTHFYVATLENKEGGLWEFVLSADGATAITMNHHGTVDVWSAQTGKRERTLTTGWTSRFSTLVFSHDGKTIATSTGSKVHLWDTNTGTEKLRMQLPGHRDENPKRHIEPNLRAAVPMERGSEIVGLAFSEYNTPLAASADSTTLAALTISGKVEIWDVATGEYRTDYDLANVPRGVPMTLLTLGLVTVPMPRTPATYHLFSTSFERAGHSLHPAIFSPNGEKLVIQNRIDAMEIWDVLTQRHLCTLGGGGPNRSTVLAFAFAFTQDGEVIAMGKGTEVHLSNTDTGKTFATFSTSKEKLSIIDKLQVLFGVKRFDVPVGAVALARAGEPLIGAASAGKTIYFWDVATRKSITLEGHASEVCQLAFSPNATFLASGDIGGSIHLWLLPAGHKLATFKPYVSPVKELVFAPDGKTLASTNLHSRFAGTILLWDVPPQ